MSSSSSGRALAPVFSRPSRTTHAALLAAVFIAGVLLARVTSGGQTHSSDLATLWSAACALEGMPVSCISSSFNRAEATWVLGFYPPWSFAFFSWFAYFPLHSIFAVWGVISAILVALALAILLRRTQTIQHVMLVTVMVVSFQPLTILLLTRQLTVIQLLGLVGFLVFANDRRPLRGALSGLLLSLSACKPASLALLYLYVFSQDCRRREGWRSLGFFAGVAGAEFAAILINPAVDSLFLSLSAEQLWYWAKPGMASMVVKTWGPIFGFVPLITVALMMLLLSRKGEQTSADERDVAALLIIPISLLVTPHAFIYDFVLLLPSLMFALEYYLQYRNTRALPGFVLLLCAAQYLLFNRLSHQHQAWWYPPLVTLLCVGAFKVRRGAP